MNFPAMSAQEATLRGWIGSGRVYESDQNGETIRVQIHLKEGVTTDDFHPVHCAYGHMDVHQADRFLAHITDVPVFPEAITDPEPWFFELVNGRLNPAFMNLFGFFANGHAKSDMGLTVSLTITRKDTLTFLAKLSCSLLAHWRNENRFLPVPNVFDEAFPISIPLIVSRLQLSSGRLLQLKTGDVLLPIENMMSINGEGILTVAGTEFDYELEPEPNNSHQHIMTITRKGPVAMNQHDNEESEFEDVENHVDGGLMQAPNENDFNDLPLDLTINCGNLSLTLGELKNLDAGSMVLVESVSPGEALLCHGKYLLAKGELINVNGSLGLQIKSMFRAVTG